MALWRSFQRIQGSWLAVSGLIVVLAACGGGDGNGSDSGNAGGRTGSGSRGTASIEPIEANIKTSIPLAYAASVAMAAVSGAVIPNAAASNTCNTFPCLATVSVTLSADDLPVSLDEYGEIFIAGLWTSSQNAVLTTSFLNLEIGSANNLVFSVSTFPVTRTGNQIVFAYGGIDIDISNEPLDTITLNDQEIEAELDRVNTPVSDDPNVNVAMDAWVVTIDTQGTDDFGDDSYSITGGGQYIGVSSTNTSVIQLGLVDMSLTPDCAINPVSGFAVLNELDISLGSSAPYPKIGAATFEFQSNCDGTAKIVAAIGTYGIIIGEDVALNL